MVQYVKSSRASSSNAKVQDVPNVPIVTGVTQSSTADVIQVSVSPATTGGVPAVYRAVASPGGAVATSYGSSPLSFSGLTDGTQYTFQVRAETGAGATSGYTVASPAITPSFAAYELISTSLISTSTGLVEWTSIPQTYKHLQIRYTARDTGAFTTRGMFLEVNGNTTTGSNSQHYLKSNGSSLSASYNTNYARFDWAELPAANSAAYYYGVGVVDIMDYASTSKVKTFKTIHGYHNGSTNEVSLWSGMWNNTAAITWLRMYTNNSFAAGSRLSLYGLKG